MHKTLKAINGENIPTFHIENYGRGSWGALTLIPSLWSSSLSLTYNPLQEPPRELLGGFGDNPVVALMEMQLLQLSMPQLSWEPWQTPAAGGTCQDSLTAVQEECWEHLWISKHCALVVTVLYFTHLGLFAHSLFRYPTTCFRESSRAASAHQAPDFWSYFTI